MDPNQVRRLHKDKGERLRTEEEMAQVRKDLEIYEPGLFYDPRKIPCFQRSILTGTGFGALFALIQRNFAIRWIYHYKMSTVGLFGFLSASTVSWVFCRYARFKKSQEEQQWVEFQTRREILQDKTRQQQEPPDVDATKA